MTVKELRNRFENAPVAMKEVVNEMTNEELQSFIDGAKLDGIDAFKFLGARVMAILARRNRKSK